MLVVLQFLPQCRLAGNTSLSRRFYKDWSVTTFVDCRFPSIHPHLITNHRYVTRSHCWVVIMLPAEKRRLITTDLVNLSASIKNIRHGMLAENYQFVIHNAVTGSQNTNHENRYTSFYISTFYTTAYFEIDHFNMKIKAPVISIQTD